MDLHSDWGLLPKDVYKIVYKREWSTLSLIKRRLSGAKKFPITIGLKPPSGRQALDDITKLQHFVQEWEGFQSQDLVEYVTKSYRSIGEQRVPKTIKFSNFSQLVGFIGKEAEERVLQWEEKFSPLLSIDDRLSLVFAENLDRFDAISIEDSLVLPKVLSQLSPGMGRGNYLRALPLEGIHTKYVETHEKLISSCLDILFDGAVKENGGLLNWLGCERKPSGWLFVRPLSPEVKEKMGGFNILKLSQEDLERYDFSASNILVVENEQTGLSLPSVEDTVSVFGGGQNVGWMRSQYLTGKSVYYWGDIDTYGFKFLNDARALCPGVISLMMDRETLVRHQNRRVADTVYDGNLPELTADEANLLDELKGDSPLGGRLEQEYIDRDYALSVIAQHIAGWPGGENVGISRTSDSKA